MVLIRPPKGYRTRSLFSLSGLVSSLYFVCARPAKIFCAVTINSIALGGDIMGDRL